MENGEKVERETKTKRLKRKKMDEREANNMKRICKDGNERTNREVKRTKESSEKAKRSQKRLQISSTQRDRPFLNHDIFTTPLGSVAHEDLM